MSIIDVSDGQKPFREKVSGLPKASIIINYKKFKKDFALNKTPRSGAGLPKASANL
jgi:hypothetical protein